MRNRRTSHGIPQQSFVAGGSRKLLRSNLETHPANTLPFARSPGYHSANRAHNGPCEHGGWWRGWRCWSPAGQHGMSQLKNSGLWLLLPHIAYNTARASARRPAPRSHAAVYS